MADAKKSLKTQIKHGCRAIPCPECAHVQKHMIRTAQHDFVYWGYAAAVGLVVIAIFGSIFVKVASNPGGLNKAMWGLVALGAIVGVASYIVGTMHDPNSVPKKRRYAVADKECIRRDDFEKQLAESMAEEFDSNFASLKKKHANGKPAEFTVPFWADRFQVHEGEQCKVALPCGSAQIRLDRDMKSGEEIEVKRTVDGVPVTFVCQLNVYTEAREKAKS